MWQEMVAKEEGKDDLNEEPIVKKLRKVRPILYFPLHSH